MLRIFDKLKLLRKRAGLRLVDLGNRINRSPSVISKMENGYVADLGISEIVHYLYGLGVQNIWIRAGSANVQIRIDAFNVGESGRSGSRYVTIDQLEKFHRDRRCCHCAAPFEFCECNPKEFLRWRPLETLAAVPDKGRRC